MGIADSEAIDQAAGNFDYPAGAMRLVRQRRMGNEVSVKGLDTGDNSRSRILEAAALLLKTKGLSRTKLSDIAERAGMLAPSLYHHFGSKNQLVEEVLLEGIYRNTKHIMARVEVLGPGASGVERLRAAIIAHVSFLLNGDDFSAAFGKVFSDLPDDVRARLLAAYSAFDNSWRDLLEAVQKEGCAQPGIHPATTRKFLIAMLDSCPEWYRPGKLNVQQIATQAADLFIKGFTKNSP